MNKQELYEEKIQKGWKIRPSSEWKRIVNRKKYAEYEVDVQLEGKVGVALVGVENPDQVNGENRIIENAKVIGWKKEAVPFDQDLRDFLDTKEKEVNAIYAITIEKVRIQDEVAEVIVYTKTNSDVTSNKYVVVRRKQLFDFKKLV